MKKSVIGRPSGPEGARSTLLAVRVTPKVKFGLEMLSRLHGTSIPDLVNRAIKDLFDSKTEGLWDHDKRLADGQQTEPINLLETLWAEKSVDRFINIGLNCEHLLTLDEKRLWRHVCNEPRYWSHETARTKNELLRDKLDYDWEILKYGGLSAAKS